MRTGAIFTALLLAAVFAITVQLRSPQKLASISPPTPHAEVENFDRPGILEEVSRPDESSNEKWWLNSGAYFYTSSGVGSTLKNELSANDPWYSRYARQDTGETDGGAHPQNIFRLVRLGDWLNFEQSVYWSIQQYHLSPDEHRTASNGIFLFNRYLDQDNVYYAGVRVDNSVVVKKKVRGVYYTLGQLGDIFSTAVYNRDTNPNLLPIKQWIGMKSRVETLPGGAVAISLYLDTQGSGQWIKVLEVIDRGDTESGPPIFAGGNAGIRTDFMDVEFDDYRIITTQEE